jgi:hypothetical protein
MGVHHLSIANPMIWRNILGKLESIPMPVTFTKPLPTDTAAILDLLKAHEAISDRLSQNADFRALQALGAMIRELRDEVAAALAPKKSAEGVDAPKSGPLVGLSHTEGALKALSHFKRPMPIAELVHILGANGLTIGGKDPPINLSSSLSKDERFESIRYEGRPCWWLRGTPLPIKEAADARPAA